MLLRRGKSSVVYMISFYRNLGRRGCKSRAARRNQRGRSQSFLSIGIAASSGTIVPPQYSFCHTPSMMRPISAAKTSTAPSSSPLPGVFHGTPEAGFPSCIHASAFMVTNYHFQVDADTAKW
jgi:hypothetical protein